MALPTPPRPDQQMLPFTLGPDPVSKRKGADVFVFVMLGLGVLWLLAAFIGWLLFAIPTGI